MGNESHVGLIKEYSRKIEAELSKICEGILKLLESQLVLSAGGAESKVFYLKMKEITKGILQSSRLVHRGMRLLRHHGCSEIAFSELAPTNPIRLGLALNFSLFYYEILNAPDRACNLAKQLKGLIQKGERLDIDLEWRMHVVSDGQMCRVQICMGLLQPYKVLLLDEITVDLDVLTRMDLLDFFKEECEQVICDTNVNQYMEWNEKRKKLTN